MAEQFTVEAFIRLGLDEASARKAVNGIKEMQIGMDTAKKKAEEAQRAYSRFAEEGEKLRNVGAQALAASAAVLAPLTAAAVDFANRYKELNREADNFLNTLNKQRTATNEIGRQASIALTPVIDQSTEYLNKISAFMAAHPDLVKQGVNAAGTLALIGTGLAASGTVLSVIGKVNQLGASGGVAGGITQAVVYVAALGLAAKGTEAAIQAYGKYTGDAALASFDLGKALRETLGTAVLFLANAFVEGRKSLSELILIVDAIKTQMQVGIDRILDQVATGFRKAVIGFEGMLDGVHDGFVGLINGLIGEINKRFGTKIETLGTVAYKKGRSPEERAAAEDAGFSQRETERGNRLATEGAILVSAQQEIQKQYETDKANLQKLADFVTSFARTGSLGPVGDQISGLINKALGQLSGGGSASAGTLAANPEGLRAFIAYQKQVTKAVNDERKAEADALKKFNEDNAKADRAYVEQRAKLESDYNRDEAKAADEYRRNEAQEDERYEKERARKIRDINDNLADLAASRDVAAYVQAQKAAKKELEDQEKDYQDGKRERAQQYRQQREEARQNFQQQLADLRNNYEREKSERRQAYNDQIVQLRQHLQEQKAALTEGLNEQLIAIGGLIGGFADTAAREMAKRQTEFNSYLASQGVRYATAPTQTYSSASGGVGGMTQTRPSGGTAKARSYALGTGKQGLPGDGWFYGHDMEIVLDRRQSDAVRRGEGLVNTFNVNVSVVNPIGAKNIIDSATEGALKGVKQALRQSRVATGSAGGG